MSDASTPADRVAAELGRQLAALRGFGFDELEHDSHVPFISHLVGTRRLLRRWGRDEAVCDAGLYHSVYGTEYFHGDGMTTPSRSTVRDLIGERAERLAWLWSAMRRDTIDPASGRVELRTHGFEVMAPREVADIADLWAADTVEQIERMTPDQRGFTGGLLRVLHLACDDARRAIEPLAELVPGAADTAVG